VRILIGHQTDIGRLRQRNEDSFLVEAPLFAVADGMGGHRGGDVASAMTLETLGDGRLPEHGPLDEVEERILRANRLVLERGEAERTLRGMGTTVTALVTEGDKAHLAHVGDSRAYLLRDGALQQLTEDHTLVQRMVREGRLRPEEAEHHPQRSILTRALGVEDELVVDKLTLPLLPGDRILLCTDGLTGMVDERDIQTVLERENDPQHAADLLVGLANEGGGDDNITVVVLHVLDDDDVRPGADAEGTAATVVDSAARGPATGAGVSSAAAGRASAVAERSQRGERDPRRRPAAEERDGFTAATPPVRVEPEPGPEARRPGVRWGRVAAWTAGVAVLVAAALIGVRLYVGQQWYVGESDGKVAIFNGIPATVVGFRLHHVERVTDLDAARVVALRPWREVKDGIPVTDLTDATGVIDRIRQDLAEASPTPASSPGVTSSPGATPPATTTSPVARPSPSPSA
jgi:PPM family protein phosphatase